MNFKKLELESFYKSVGPGTVGDGKSCKKILVGDSEDARTANFSFVANIKYNRPSWGEIKFDNGVTMYLPSQSIHGKRAYMFLCNELTENLWRRQNERTKLMDWVGSARPEDIEDINAMCKLIVELTGSGRRIYEEPMFARFNMDHLQIKIPKLSLKELEKLNSIMDQPDAASVLRFAKAA